MKLLQLGEHTQLFYFVEDSWEERDLAEEDEEQIAAIRDVRVDKLAVLDSAEVDYAGINVDRDTKQRLRELRYID